MPNALNDAAAANSLIERANFPIKNLNRLVGAHGLKVPKALLKRKKNINEFSKVHNGLVPYTLNDATKPSYQ